jgi:imidazolonepropionase
MKTIAVINCSQLVTLAGPARPRVGPELRELGIIPDGWRCLFAMESSSALEAELRSKRSIDADTDVVDAGGRVVLPGFVDAHTHPVFAGTRVDEFEERSKGATYQEIAARGGGIQSTVNQTRAASVDDLVAAGRVMRRGFCVAARRRSKRSQVMDCRSKTKLKILRAIKQLDDETSLRYVPTFLGAHSIPPEYRSRRDEYVSLLIDEMLPRVAQEKLAEYCDVFCEEKVFTTDESWKILSAARCHGLGLRMHADQLSLSGGAKLAAELGTVTADHLEHTDAEGIAALKGRRRATGAVAGFGLCARIDALSGGARNDRRRSGCSAGN